MEDPQQYHRVTKKEKIDEELKAYLAENSIDWNVRDSALVWWGEHESKYPIIAVLAGKYLAIPASSAPSECVFSSVIMKITLDRKRWSIDPERLELLILAKSNAHL